MKTSYNDFILWYLTNCFSKSGDGYEDDLLIIQANSYVYVHQELAGKTIPEYIKEHYENGTLNSLMQIKHDYVSDFITSSDHYRSRQPEWTSAFKVQIKSELLTQMINNCAIDKWVDIENLFYSSLKKALTVENQNKDRDVKDLNKSIAFIIEELRVYLANLGHCKERIDEYRILMKEAIRPSEIVERPPLTPDDLLGTVPNNTLILNFNYTDTVEQYLSDDSNVKVNYIHGKLNENENPMIFGFGDELDAEYSKFELDRTKELFKYIKSFWYFKTSNYHDLLRFIQGETFQVYILGHSCGLSDRTMLNMIFEHENCVSIKIYYYENPQEISKNNYTELTEEISRHFKDKRQMRLKIVPFDKSSCMPQISPF
ncbi:hypothetical protein AQF98_05650 [Pedobacter sp. Hv1]|nr:hypothetical protein AQF98_05650 [Pedobacter sp. Hv1]